MNRAMIVTVLYRLAGSPAVTGEVAFNDVASGLWYSSAVIWADANGIVEGFGDGRFAPLQNVTREEDCLLHLSLCCLCRPGYQCCR